mmetsp:Transcript_23914/g.47569  ORF Transcript_23914/g.47569 Transcript_23914/m.47569 type:complete len:104 (-) Transcript_23914:541-852(-)
MAEAHGYQRYSDELLSSVSHLVRDHVPSVQDLLHRGLLSRYYGLLSRYRGLLSRVHCGLLSRVRDLLSHVRGLRSHVRGLRSLVVKIHRWSIHHRYRYRYLPS